MITPANLCELVGVSVYQYFESFYQEHVAYNQSVPNPCTLTLNTFSVCTIRLVVLLCRDENQPENGHFSSHLQCEMDHSFNNFIALQPRLDMLIIGTIA